MVNAGLRDTDAWQAARGQVIESWARRVGVYPHEARRELSMLGRPRGERGAIGELVASLSAELKLSAE